jgi:putative PIN family toxin of toxin-antitoxin system
VKVVLDSNVYVSAFGFDAGPEKIIALGLATNFRIYSSVYIIEEVKRVLHEKLGMSERFSVLAGKRIERYSHVMPIRGGPNGPEPTDPKDGPIVKTCLASRADFLVTGDKKLATLAVRGMKIVSPAQFLRHLRTQGIV